MISKKLNVVLDTDTFNEVDDQFALAHLLMSPEVISLEAVYAAPFSNHRASTPGEGMEKSYDEIHRVMEHLHLTQKPPVFRGSTSYLPGAHQPVSSEAVNDLIERALKIKNGEEPLHVLAIAAATNIASALLTAPEIAEKIKVIWLGGHAPYWPHTQEFNLQQDLHSARVLLDHSVPLVLLPCYPVSSHLITTVAELEKDLAPYSGLGNYLTECVRNYEENPLGWSKPIWDIAASAWAIKSEWIPTELKPSPILKDDLTWKSHPQRRIIEVAREINRDAVFADFFQKAKKLPR